MTREERKELLESSGDSREVLVHDTSRNLIYLIYKQFMKRTRAAERTKNCRLSSFNERRDK